MTGASEATQPVFPSAFLVSMAAITPKDAGAINVADTANVSPASSEHEKRSATLDTATNNLIGATLQHHWSYWILAVGWAMHNLATIVTTAAVGAYLIDAYPEASGESAAWLNFWRTLGGFIVGYVQIGWVEGSGPLRAYGVQSGIMAGAFVVVVGLQFGGRRLRRWQGGLEFRTN